MCTISNHEPVKSQFQQHLFLVFLSILLSVFVAVKIIFWILLFLALLKVPHALHNLTRVSFCPAILYYMAQAHL